MGDWEGQTISALDRCEDWRMFNTFRSGVRPPGGELMMEAQARMVIELDRLRQQHRGECVAVISHADPLRAALTHYLGIPFDLALRMEVSPASVSVIQLENWGPRVLCISQTGEIPVSP
jgi:broad specificity phosphatase PhoE